MSFVAEDGSGVSNANSLAAVAAADTYFADRGSAEWSALDAAAKQVALIKATDFIERVYWRSFRGIRKTTGQALSWPRSDVYFGGDATRPVADDAVPDGVLQATFELALRSTTTTLMPDEATESGSVIREKVGDLEVEYGRGQHRSQPLFREVAIALVPYLLSAPGVVRLVRS